MPRGPRSAFYPPPFYLHPFIADLLGHLTVYHQFYVNQISLLINLNVISLITIRKCLKKCMTLVCHKLSKQSVLNVIHVVPCLVSLLNRVVNNYHLYVFCINS